MNTLPTWALPALAGAVAAALAVLMSSRRRDERAEPARGTSQEPWMPTLLTGALAAMIVGWIWGRPGPAIAVLVLWQGVHSLLRARRRQRRAELEDRHAIQAIGAASRSLRAGIPMAGMLQMLAAESEGQTRVALREVVQREGLGEELAIAIRRVLLRSPLASLRAFGLALVVQGSAGGNLADATDRLAMSLLERARVRRRARTIMAYSRTATSVLSVTPLIAVPVLSWTVDGYTRVLLDRPEGNMILAVAAAMLITGLVMIQRMSRIESVPDWGRR
ncbi:MAG: type II secretion system F family protein [Planctomycetota bacterium]